MKKILFALLFAGFLLPATVSAQTLTTTQVNSIIGILSAFGVQQSVINQVYTDLTTTSTTTAATSTPTVSQSAPVATTTTQTATPTPTQTTTPSKVCSGSSCVTYGAAPVVQPTTTTPTPVQSTKIGACKITLSGSGVSLTQSQLVKMASSSGLILPKLSWGCRIYSSRDNALGDGAFFAYPVTATMTPQQSTAVESKILIMIEKGQPLPMI